MPEQTSQQHDRATSIEGSDLPCDLPCDLAVVILNYNTCSLLRDCLVSVRPQRHNLRMCVVVVDNASTDGSAAISKTTNSSIQLKPLAVFPRRCFSSRLCS